MRKFDPAKVPKPKQETMLEIDYNKPFCLEIGAGVGMHAVRFGQSSPNHTLVAIEREKERFAKMQRRVQKHHLQNVIPIRSEAVRWVVHNCKSNSIEELFLWYPNPEPKTKRWHRMPFMEFLIDCLQPGGKLWLATNIAEMRDEAVAAYTQVWGLMLEYCLQVNPHKQKPRTHFEKKYLERGEDCYELLFKKP